MTPLSVAAYAARVGRTAAFRRKPVSLPRVTIKQVPEHVEPEPPPSPPQLAPPSIKDTILAAVAAHMKSIATPAVVRSGRIVPSVELVMRETALAYGIPQYIIRAHDRRTHETRIRQVFYYLAREMSGQSMPDIGRRCGGRDHTTILHGYHKIAAELKTDTALAAQVAVIKSRVNAIVQRSIAKSNGGTDAGHAS